MAWNYRPCAPNPEGRPLTPIGEPVQIIKGPFQITLSVWQDPHNGSFWINKDVSPTAGGQGVEVWTQAVRGSTAPTIAGAMPQAP